jgi:TPR repeat protein
MQVASTKNSPTLPEQAATIPQAIQHKIKVAYPTYHIINPSTLNIRAEYTRVQIKNNVMCINNYFVHHAQSLDEKLHLLHLLNQPEYENEAFVIPLILQQQEEAAKNNINKQYDYAHLCSKYTGKGAQLISTRKLIQLAYHYYQDTRQQNKTKAFTLFLHAAERGEGQAQNMIAMMYYHGIGITSDASKAFYWAKLAAKQNNCYAQYLLGKLYMIGQKTAPNEQKAFRYLKLAADKGHKTAQVFLGSLYLEGRGTVKDEKTGFYYIQLAAKQHDPNAQYILGMLYFKGQGTAQNEVKSFYYIELAAKEHHREAQFFLGHYYQSGFGTAKNEQKGFRYIKLAADKNYGFAQCSLAWAFNDRNNDKTSTNYIKQAAQHTDQEIQHQVATFYWYKRHRTAEEETQAITLYLQLANQGHIRSMLMLVFCYLQQNDSEEAGHWLKYLEQLNDPLTRNLTHYIAHLKENDTEFPKDIFEMLCHIMTINYPAGARKNLAAESPSIALDPSATLSSTYIPPVSSLPPLTSNKGEEKLNKAKLFRQLKTQSSYAKQQQKVMEMLKEKRKKGENITLQTKNAAIAQKILHAKNVKLTLGEFSRLFNDPAFNDQVKITPTASGFKITAKCNTTEVVETTHWPHDGHFNFHFLKGLERIIKEFVSSL